MVSWKLQDTVLHQLSPNQTGANMNSNLECFNLLLATLFMGDNAYINGLKFVALLSMMFVAPFTTVYSYTKRDQMTLIMPPVFTGVISGMFFMLVISIVTYGGWELTMLALGGAWLFLLTLTNLYDIGGKFAYVAFAITLWCTPVLPNPHDIPLSGFILMVCYLLTIGVEIGMYGLVRSIPWDNKQEEKDYPGYELTPS